MSDANELTELMAEKAALQCALHALVHTVASHEGPTDALRHFDNLAGGWVPVNEVPHTRAQFRYHAEHIRRMLAGRIADGSGMEIHA